MRQLAEIIPEIQSHLDSIFSVKAKTENVLVSYLYQLVMCQNGVLHQEALYR